MKQILLAALFFATQLSWGAGKIQNEDVKTLAELTGAGGSGAQLINDTKIWVSSVTPAQQLSSAITGGLIGGGGGSKNYLSTYRGNTGNGDFEFNATTGWSLFNTTLTSGIPTGAISAGAASLTTFAATTSGALQKTYSLNVASSGTVTAGQGFLSSAFTIDPQDAAKVLTFKAYYQAITGAANMNFSGTSSNTWAVYIYDTTNAAWIQPAGVYGITQSSGAGYVTGTFQTTSNSTQYRLAIVAVNASAGATSMNWDDFSVGPQTAPIGVPVSDWKSFSPTILNLSKGNGTFSGFWRRVGDSVEFTENITFGSTTSASGNFQPDLPNGLALDSTKLTSNDYVGEWKAIDNSATVENIGFLRYTGAIRFTPGYNGVSGSADVGTNVPWTWAVGDTFEFHAIIPVQGWSSNVQMSNDTDTRVVTVNTAGIQTPTGTLNSSFNTAVFGAISTDTHAAYNTSTGVYTVPVSGYYRASAFLNINHASAAVNSFIGVGIFTSQSGTTQFQNYERVQATTTVNLMVATSGVFFANAGSTVEVRGLSSATTPAYSSSLGGSGFSIERLTGPSVVAATESVNARYSTAAGQSITSASQATVIFGTKSFDSHNAMNTSTGIYTCPVSGKYSVVSYLRFTTGGTWTASSSMFNVIQKNGSDFSRKVFTQIATHTQNVENSISDVVDCLAGDNIRIQVFQNTGGSLALNSSALDNWVSITRVGN